MVKVQTFLGKATIDGLHQMDTHINEWMKRHSVKPLHIQQSFGSDRHHDGRNQEPIIVISIWYEAAEEAVL